MRAFVLILLSIGLMVPMILKDLPPREVKPKEQPSQEYLCDVIIFHINAPSEQIFIVCDK